MRTIKYFGSSSLSYPAFDATHILHVNTNTSGQTFLENYMKGINSFPCNGNQPVYVPQVENDWVNQYINYVAKEQSLNNTWNVNYGPPVWFRYGLDPIGLTYIRANDLLPNYVPCSSIPLRLTQPQELKKSATLAGDKSVHAFPNPFSNESVEITTQSQVDLFSESIRITDMTGRDITDLFEIKTIHKKAFEIKLLKPDIVPAGIYICAFGDKTNFYRVKLLKQ